MSIQVLPNIITGVRIVLAPIIGLLIYSFMRPLEPETRTLLALIAFLLFLIASLTDALDGYIARRYNAASELGEKLDLWADKILVFCILLAVVPSHFPLALFGLLCLSARDLFIMWLRAKRPDVRLKASALAKMKTALIFISIGICLFGFMGVQGSIAQAEEPGLMMVLLRIGLSLFIFSCMLSLGTAWQYLRAVQKKDAAY